MTLIKLRLDFLFTDISQRFGMYLVVFALNFFIHQYWVRSDLKLEVICVIKSKVIQPQPKYKTRNFLKQNSLRKRLLIVKPKTNQKVLLGLIINTITTKFLVCVCTNSSITLLWSCDKGFAINVLLNVYICALRSNSGLFFLREQ